MGGVSFRDGTLVVERPATELDELAIAFSEILTRLEIEHVFIAGYLAILTGRARATDDIDVLIEVLSEGDTDRLVAALRERGYWSPETPLDAMYESLSAGTNVRVAPSGQTTPHVEVKFPTDEFDRASLTSSIDAHVAGTTIPVGPLELQIAYKLFLRGRKDFEDAAHPYRLFRETLCTDELEQWVERLDVTEEYERLKSS